MLEPYTYSSHQFGGRTAKLPNNHGGIIGRHWAKGRFYEQALLRFVRAQTAAGTYLDAGMNIGNHSLFFAKFCKSRTVYAFEPYIRHILRAEELFQANDVHEKIRVFNCALSDQPGEISINIANQPATVPALRVDDLGLTDLAVMKIDVEGAEDAVLRGAYETLGRCRPLLLVEVFDENYDANVTILADMGYQIGEKFGPATYAFKPI